MTLEELRVALRRTAAITRRIVGVPDYDAYLTHVRSAHPEREPMTREEFTESRMQDRYSRPGHRCC
jgi:uncharacterized short protein YbdD (DUF466 family)